MLVVEQLIANKKFISPANNKEIELYNERSMYKIISNNMINMKFIKNILNLDNSGNYIKEFANEVWDDNSIVLKEIIDNNSYVFDDVESKYYEDTLVENIYELDLDIPINILLKDDIFIDWIRYKMITQLEDLLRKIDMKVSNGKIKIFRSMTVRKDWFDYISRSGKHLGIFWSWSLSAADAHWGNTSDSITITIESEIHEKYVDWDNTIDVNFNPHTGLFFDGSEKEIRLYKGTPLKIIKIYDKDKRSIQLSKSILKKQLKA